MEPLRDNQTQSDLPRVLIIDDDQLVRSALTRSLRRLGYEVVVASTGEEGIEKALSARPAVILCDLRMPGMDGRAVLRSLAAVQPAPVIVMTGQDVDDITDVLQAGALAYIQKPWRAADLARTLRDTIYPPKSP